MLGKELPWLLPSYLLSDYQFLQMLFTRSIETTTTIYEGFPNLGFPVPRSTGNLTRALIFISIRAS